MTSTAPISVKRAAWSLPGNLTHLTVPLALLIALLVAALIRAPQLFTSDGVAGALIVATPLILAAVALTPIVLVGRGSVDLSIGPLIGFINVTLVKWLVENGIQSPIAVFAYVIFAGMAYQLIQGLIIVYVRVAPIIVALSGYLVLTGVNLVILQRPSGQAPDFMASWGQGTSILSPILYVLILAMLFWFAVTRTGFFTNLRLTGSDERAAYTSGVPTDYIRLAAHLLGGVFAGLAALSYTALISSGDPTQGSTYTLSAVTALVLGGTSLSGGRGGAIGSVLGAVNMYLISYVLATFSFGVVSGFVTQMAFGLILVVSLLVNVFLTK
jgi:ribose transport system permease protein